MTPVIRIDDEVMSDWRAMRVSMELVFGTPNQTLRRLLALDSEPR